MACVALHTTEVVAATLSGIRRTYAAAGERPRRQAAPLLVDDVVDAGRGPGETPHR